MSQLQEILSKVAGLGTVSYLQKGSKYTVPTLQIRILEMPAIHAGNFDSSQSPSHASPWNLYTNKPALLVTIFKLSNQVILCLQATHLCFKKKEKSPVLQCNPNATPKICNNEVLPEALLRVMTVTGSCISIPFPSFLNLTLGSRTWYDVAQ